MLRMLFIRPGYGPFGVRLTVTRILRFRAMSVGPFTVCFLLYLSLSGAVVDTAAGLVTTAAVGVASKTPVLKNIVTVYVHR
jgi:hypothetical protein